MSVKAYSPQQFGNFGKDAKDLFKKQYDFENQLVYKGSSPYSIETRIVSPADGPLRGVFKSAIKVSDCGKLNGTLESELHTVSDKESKTSYKFTNLAKNVSVKLGVSAIKPDVKGDTPDFPEGWASAEADYAQEYVAGSVAVRSNGQKTLADIVLALGYENLSVGTKVVVDTASKVAPTDFNVSAQYVGANYTATGVTEKKRTALTLSYAQAITRNQQFGVSATFGLVKPTRTLTFGTKVVIDIDTAIRTYVKIDSTKDVSTVGFAISHNIASPAAQINVATEYNVSPSTITAAKFGVTISIGDF